MKIASLEARSAMKRGVKLSRCRRTETRLQHSKLVEASRVWTEVGFMTLACDDHMNWRITRIAHSNPLRIHRSHVNLDDDAVITNSSLSPRNTMPFQEDKELCVLDQPAYAHHGDNRLF